MKCAIIQVIFNFPTTKQEIQNLRRYLIFFFFLIFFLNCYWYLSRPYIIHWMWKWLIYLEREGKLCLEKLLFLGYICQLRNTKGPRVTQLWLRYYKLLYGSLVIFMLLYTTLSPFFTVGVHSSCCKVATYKLIWSFFYPLTVWKEYALLDQKFWSNPQICAA